MGCIGCMGGVKSRHLLSPEQKAHAHAHVQVQVQAEAEAEAEGQ